jgi:multisubunit Na+/H+ antiporter MnhE subunit
MRRVRSLLVGVLLACPFYLLLIDTVSTPELYAGLGAVLLAAFAYEVSYAQGFGDAVFRLTWLLPLRRVLANVVPQILVVCREALLQLLKPQRSRGTLRAARFRAGNDENAHDLGRRALAEALGSLTPNTIVIGIDPQSNLLLVHQLRLSGGREQLDPLELG